MNRYVRVFNIFSKEATVLSITVPFYRRRKDGVYDLARHAMIFGDAELIVAFGWNISKYTFGVSKTSWFPHMIWAWNVIPEAESQVRYI